MKKITFLIAAFVAVFISLSGFAQTLRPVCGTDERYRKNISEHPEYLIERQSLEDHTAAYTANTNHPEATVYIIPMVFHIIHNYGSENISDAQVIDQVRILNEDFRKLNADIVDVIPTFQGITADCEIEFRLATLDPNGNCTNGIDRVASMETFIGDESSKLNDWPRNKYLNVWVVNNVGEASGGTYVVGYSQFPGSSSSAGDGIIFRSDFIGSIGTGHYNHDLSHEVGHYLNLYHTWGGTNSPGTGISGCGNDQVSDTPTTDGSAFGCNLSKSLCSPPAIENVQNIMEYSSCTKMFTEGQKTRMRAALTSSTASRNNLWTSGNLAATGATVSPSPVCSPKADFVSNSAIVCVGSSVNFTDKTWNAKATSWSWSFTGGTPATSTDSMPVISYGTPGTYAVSLTSTNSAGSNSTTKTSFITVVDTTLKKLSPVLESFEAASYPNADWAILNPDNGPTWAKTTSAHTSGAAAMKVSNFSGSVAGQVETLISPLYDYTTATSKIFTFKLAYAPKSSTSTDELRVAFSLDCGATWQYRYDKTSADLSTAGIKTSSFTPTLASQWRTETINIQPYANKRNVRVKFEFISGGDGNNIYIDDICINWISGIETAEDFGFNASIYPNPFSNETTLSLDMPLSETVSITVNNILGQTVFSSPEKILSDGNHNIPVKLEEPAGVYFMRIQIGDKQITRKLIINK